MNDEKHVLGKISHDLRPHDWFRALCGASTKVGLPGLLFAS